jgi:hypothetical protein
LSGKADFIGLFTKERNHAKLCPIPRLKGFNFTCNSWLLEGSNRIDSAAEFNGKFRKVMNPL